MTRTGTISPSRIASLRRREDASFDARRPRSRALFERARRSMPNGVPMSWMMELYEHAPVFVAAGEGATFTDVDGHRYFDTNIGDMSTFCGIDPGPVVEAVARQARRGLQFLLPVEDAVWVAEELSRRLISIFCDDGDGRRPVFGPYEKFQVDPALHGMIPFHEYFHGDTGQGLGASHQTGWTGLVADLITRRTG